MFDNLPLKEDTGRIILKDAIKENTERIIFKDAIKEDTERIRLENTKCLSRKTWTRQ